MFDRVYSSPIPNPGGNDIPRSISAMGSLADITDRAIDWCRKQVARKARSANERAEAMSQQNIVLEVKNFRNSMPEMWVRAQKEGATSAELLKFRKQIIALRKAIMAIQREFDSMVDNRDSGAFGKDVVTEVTRIRKARVVKTATKSDSLDDAFADDVIELQAENDQGMLDEMDDDESDEDNTDD